MGSQGRDPDEITVLVTGFGPFRAQYPVNPSYEIAKGLPDYLPPLRAKDANARAVHAESTGSNGGGGLDLPEVRILTHPEPIRVNYRTVRALVPKLWKGQVQGEEHQRQQDDGDGSVVPDIVLHIGMAGPRPFYAVERKGHREGYKAPDVDGELLEDEAEGGHGEAWTWYGCPDRLETDLDMVDILGLWEKYSPSEADLRLSDDAGLYLCDFIYYSSLAHLWKQGKERNVTFLHVPADASEEAVARGRELTVNLIRAIVESEVKRRRERKMGRGGLDQ